MATTKRMAVGIAILGMVAASLGFFLGTDVCSPYSPCPVGVWDYVRGGGVILGVLGGLLLLGNAVYSFDRP
ncbi:MAG: hypothetical protein ABEJ76_08390 [Halanaeroarchaeum sp.]